MLRIAQFFKVSREKYQPWEQYDDIKLPKRATVGSAGYDFYAPYDIVLEPNQTETVPTGIRVRIDDGWVLMLSHARGGLNTGSLQQYGRIIDSITILGNEGIFISITTAKALTIKKGELSTGRFVRWHIVADDCQGGGTRFGSTVERKYIESKKDLVIVG
jgi:dUTP pyrophosphatase